MDDIMKISRSFEESGVLIKRLSKKIKREAKKQNESGLLLKCLSKVIINEAEKQRGEFLGM